MQIKDKEYKYKNPRSKTLKAKRRTYGSEDEAVNIGAETKKVGRHKNGLSQGNSFCH